jgi:hypothetical protein
MTKALFTIVVFVGFGSSLAEANPGLDLCPRRSTSIFEETFSSGGNEGGWTVSSGGYIERQGGSLGAFLHGPGLETFAPLVHTEPGTSSLFTGDYRAQAVVELSAEFKIFVASETVAERPMTVVLVNDSNTPDDIMDDLYVYYVGQRNIPRARQGWTRYAFDIPSDSPGLPFPRSTVEGEPGWVATQGDVFTPARDPDATWNAVIQDVDQVIFWFHDPRYFAFLQNWDVGVDNPSIATCTAAQ